MNITIIGAGMAGLLAGNMLRSLPIKIIERAPSVPNNHHALLRFRTTNVGDAVGVPFRPVQVIKSVHSTLLTDVAMAMSYAMKVNNTVSGLRSIVSGADSKIETRFIAPPNLIQNMVDGLNCKVEFGKSTEDVAFGDSPVISTIPMPSLASALGYKFSNGTKFIHIDGMVLRAKLKLPGFDAYATVYTPDQSDPFYRVSITGNEIIAEIAGNKQGQDDIDCLLTEALNVLGLSGLGAKSSWLQTVELVSQKYAKIVKIDDNERKRFIMWATEEAKVYSLGRYATWRPGLLMDDVVKDVRVIQKMIFGASDHSYNTRKQI